MHFEVHVSFTSLVKHFIIIASQTAKKLRARGRSHTFNLSVTCQKLALQEHGGTSKTSVHLQTMGSVLLLRSWWLPLQLDPRDEPLLELVRHAIPVLA